jgi:hypothetical protein
VIKKALTIDRRYLTAAITQKTTKMPAAEKGVEIRIVGGDFMPSKNTAQRPLIRSSPQRIATAEELETHLTEYVRHSENALARWVLRGVVALALILVAAWATVFVLKDTVPPSWGMNDFWVSDPSDLEAEENPSLTKKVYKIRKNQMTLKFAPRDRRSKTNFSMVSK